MLERPFGPGRRSAISALQGLALVSFFAGLALGPAVLTGSAKLPSWLASLPGAQRMVGGTLLGLIPLTIAAAVLGSARLLRGVGRFELRPGGLWVRPRALNPSPGEDGLAIPWEDVLEVRPVRGGVLVHHAGEGAIERRVWPLVLPVEGPAEEERLLALLGRRAALPGDARAPLQDGSLPCAVEARRWHLATCVPAALYLLGPFRWDERLQPAALDLGLFFIGLAGAIGFQAWWASPRRGRVGLRPDGLERGSVRIPWESLEELACAGGWLAARGAGRRIVARAATAPWMLDLLRQASPRAIAYELPAWARAARGRRDAWGLAGLGLASIAALGLLVRALPR